MRGRYKILKRKIGDPDYQELCNLLQSLIDKVKKQEARKKCNLVDIAVRYEKEIVRYLTQKSVV